MPKRDVDEMDYSQDSEIDEIGETKVDEDGELLEGRQYKIPTFVLPRHPSRLYMLTVDVAKTLGFKDTHVFLNKNPSFPKLVATDQDREAMQDQDLVPSQLRNKTISILSARSVFKGFGHKIVKKGRVVKDDYAVGDREEVPEETDISSDIVRDYVQIYKDFPYRPSDTNRPDPAYLEPLDGPEGLKQDDWMYRCVLSAAEFNRTMAVGRPKRFWDPHTNIEHVSKSIQPTRTFIESCTTYDPMGPGKVNVNAHIADKNDPHWKVLELDEDAEKYPVAVIPGQRQYAFSVYIFVSYFLDLVSVLVRRKRNKFYRQWFRQLQARKWW
jgi:hypothetical protein